MDLCRICLFKTDSKVTVFSEAKNGQKISVILENIGSIQIEEEDGLPFLICPSCEAQVNNFIDFQTLIQDSNFSLQQTKSLYIEDPLGVSVPIIVFKEEEEPQCKFKERSSTPDLTKVVVKKDRHFVPEDITIKVRKKRIRKREKTFSCPGCDKTFRYNYELVAHSTTHTGKEPYRCEICNKAFIYKGSLLLHTTVHSTIRPHKCQECGKCYKQPGALSIHIRTSHNTRGNGKKLPCEVCGKTFHFRSQLELHSSVHNGQKKFICEICSKEYSHPYNLTRHLKTHEYNPTVQCSICGKTLANRKSLSKHLQTHSEETPFSCDVCHKRFKFRNILKNHMEIHKEVKKYVCKICDKRFTFNSVLYRHMRIHSGEKPFKCELCDKMFSHSHHLVSHVKREHSNQ